MPRVVSVKSKRLAGVLLNIAGAEVEQANPIPGLWREIAADDRRVELDALRCFRQKEDFGVHIVNDDGSVDYLIAVAVEAEDVVPDWFYECHIPQGEYLAVETTSVSLEDAWIKIVKRLDEKGYEVAGNTFFELYDNPDKRPDKAGDNAAFEVYVPIAKA